MVLPSWRVPRDSEKRMTVPEVPIRYPVDPVPVAAGLSQAHAGSAAQDALAERDALAAAALPYAASAPVPLTVLEAPGRRLSQSF